MSIFTQRLELVSTHEWIMQTLENLLSAGMDQFQFVSGTKTELARDPFLVMDYSTVHIHTI